MAFLIGLSFGPTLENKRRELDTQDWQNGRLSVGDNEKGVPARSTESTAELTRWITVTMEACERWGEGGRRGMGGWADKRDLALVQMSEGGGRWHKTKTWWQKKLKPGQDNQRRNITTQEIFPNSTFLNPQKSTWRFCEGRSGENEGFCTDWLMHKTTYSTSHLGTHEVTTQDCGEENGEGPPGTLVSR